MVCCSPTAAPTAAEKSATLCRTIHRRGIFALFGAPVAHEDHGSAHCWRRTVNLVRGSAGTESSELRRAVCGNTTEVIAGMVGTVLPIMDAPPDTFDNQIGPLRSPCDLDMLLFFSRHSRSLLTSEKLAEYVGYDVKQVGRSLDWLITAGILTRSQNPTHEARLYVFIANPYPPWLKSLLICASTREGRAALIARLKQRDPDKSEKSGKGNGSVASNRLAQQQMEIVRG